MSLNGISTDITQEKEGRVALGNLSPLLMVYFPEAQSMSKNIHPLVVVVRYTNTSCHILRHAHKPITFTPV